MWFSIGTFVCSLAFVGYEIWQGKAHQGFTGTNTIVRRDKHPGPYWFVIFLHAVTGGFFTAIAAAIE